MSGAAPGATGAGGRALRVVLLLGVAWRLLRYAQRYALSDDESFVTLNLMDGDWLGVLRPLRAQVVPVLFLWVEKAVLRLVGPSEYGLRLLPLLAGLLGVALFWRLARRHLEPLAASLAAGLLAVSYFPVRFSSEVKSYSLDLLATVVLLSLALDWLGDTGRLRPLALFAAAAPLLVALSYPSCLVVASVGVVLLPPVARHPDRRVKLLFLAGGAAAFAVFLASYLRVGLGQFAGQGGFANEYWQLHDAFPPLRPVGLLAWLFRLASGLVFAYPLGDVAGVPALTFLLCVWGGVRLGRSGRKDLLALCVLPFAWTFLVAAARLYPLGPHPRIAQHLAPPICLLAGAGLAAALRRGAPGASRLSARESRALAVLAVLAVAGMALEVLQPYRSGRDEAFRRLAAEIASGAGPEDLVVYHQAPDDGTPVPPPLEFYLRKERLRVDWTGDPDLGAAPAPQQVWIIANRQTAPPETLARRLLGAEPPFALAAEQPHALKTGVDRSAPVPCSVSLWRRVGP